MNSTKVARTTRTILKLIGPCEILSHGQKSGNSNFSVLRNLFASRLLDNKINELERQIHFKEFF